ncbi:MAG: ribose-phosphate pyrophosphokinase [Patescibacteria group bacterium]|jgi:ribose-phosphate pyrophosphokinase
MLKNVIIFSGNANRLLAEEICRHLKIKLGQATVSTFKDGETNVKIGENVRRKEVYIIQPTCRPVNDHLMELWFMIDACRRASAEIITVVVPYFGYGRQEKKTEPHVPISAKVVFDFLVLAGANRIITMDLHAVQCQGFTNIPVDNLFAEPVLITYIKKTFGKKKLILVSPDVGGVARTRSYAKRLGVGIAIIDKRRPKPNQAQVMNIVGDVKGKIAILVDDMVDTAGTLVGVTEAIKQAGALEVHMVCTHPVLSENAVAEITKSALSTMAVTNTIPLSTEAAACQKIRIVSVSWLISGAIRRSHTGESVTSLFY